MYPSLTAATAAVALSDRLRDAERSRLTARPRERREREPRKPWIALTRLAIGRQS